jgi:altronate dehydratase large subunit
LVNNPNFGAVLFVGLGCENMTAEIMMMQVQDKPAEALVIQDVGGSAATTEKGLEITKKFIEKLAGQERVAAPISKLTVGLECGGSDAFSGVTANPAVGAAADLFVGEDATVILAETTEMIGTAHILKRRGATPRVGEQVERLVIDHEKHVRDKLGDLVGMVISPGNVEGGLSSITEKSLGCITKGGTTPIQEVVEYAGRPSKQGLVIMDTPGFDIESMSGMAAGGAQIMIFTTGRGSAAGFPGVPVVKVASNSRMFNKMVGDMDVNAGSIIDGGKTLDAIGKEIFDLTVEVAGGKQTCAEINRSVPFSILKQGPSF